MPPTSPVVLIACDKFKGTLTASQACEAVAAGIKAIWPQAQCLLYPIADGGEGTARILCDARQGIWETTTVTGPLGDEVSAGWAWIPGDATGIIEMSEASGLKLLPPERRNPWRATTVGTGQLIAAAMARGAEELIVAIGGSATNDGGTGMAWALGYRFYDHTNEPFFPVPALLAGLHHIEPPTATHWPRITAASDVENPLLGPTGCTRVYGPQKGIRLERMEEYEAALSQLVSVVQRDLGIHAAELPGAGAAGGMGFGLMSFIGATIEPGFNFVAAAARLPEAILLADLIITGEGCVDEQTLHGKGPAGVADLARRHAKPVVVAGGIVQDKARGALAAKFHAVLACTSIEDLSTALLDPTGSVTRAIIAARDELESLLAD